MRSIRRVVVAVVGLLLVAGLAQPASSAAASISVTEFKFTPASYRGTLGGAVEWGNAGTYAHQPWQDAPLNLWKKPPVAPGASTTPINLFDAGTFAYHCNIHPFMHGKVQVPVTTNITTGAVGAGIRVNVATRAHPNFTFDVTRKIGAGKWKVFKTGVKGDWVTMKAAAAGTYVFKARLVRIKTKAASGWSLSATVTIS